MTNTKINTFISRTNKTLNADDIAALLSMETKQEQVDLLIKREIYKAEAEKWFWDCKNAQAQQEICNNCSCPEYLLTIAALEEYAMDVKRHYNFGHIRPSKEKNI